MTRTFVAWGPLPDSPSSYSTFAPSASVRKPSPAMPEKCTQASFPPSSGVMNPKPFSSLNHFTTPVAIQHLLTLQSLCARWCCRALPSRMLNRPGGGPTRGLYQARRRPPSARGGLRAAARVARGGALGGRRLLRRLLRRRLVEIGVEVLLAPALVLLAGVGRGGRGGRRRDGDRGGGVGRGAVAVLRLPAGR